MPNRWRHLEEIREKTEHEKNEDFKTGIIGLVLLICIGLIFLSNLVGLMKIDYGVTK